MSTSGGQIAGSTAARDMARDWEAVRAQADIQYVPVKPAPPPTQPDWLVRLGKWLDSVLRELFGPVGEWLGVSWPVLKYALMGLAALSLAAMVWFWVIRPLLDSRRLRSAREPEPEWAPDRAAAVALLSDADRLAAEGRYGEAAHLLLQRSVSHIAEARPDWLDPASTAREIAALPALPQRARLAFAAISSRVERSLFALRDLDASDWQAARAAYADFALQRLAPA